MLYQHSLEQPYRKDCLCACNVGDCLGSLFEMVSDLMTVFQFDLAAASLSFAQPGRPLGAVIRFLLQLKRSGSCGASFNTSLFSSRPRVIAGDLCACDGDKRGVS
jgi:hypothetical protein